MGGSPLLGADARLATLVESAPWARHRHTTARHKPWGTNTRKGTGCALTLTSTSLVTRHTWGGSDTATTQARHDTIPTAATTQTTVGVSTHFSYNSYHRVRGPVPIREVTGMSSEVTLT